MPSDALKHGRYFEETSDDRKKEKNEKHYFFCKNSNEKHVHSIIKHMQLLTNDLVVNILCNMFCCLTVFLKCNQLNLLNLRPT
jgi:hypothetical protein